MTPCTECGTLWASRLAAVECADFDVAEDAKAREWFAHHPTGAVRRFAVEQDV